MRRALLVAILAVLSLPSARATTLVGPGLHRDELIELEGERDAETGRPFPFGASSVLTDLQGFESPWKILTTWVGDRLILLDPETNLFYEVDPFTGEGHLLTRLQVANPGPASTNPGGDFDGDGVPNSLDLCPRHPTATGDEDADGVGDLCDSCPTRFNPRTDEFERPFYQSTTEGQPDSDVDGIGDACDCDFTEESDSCNLDDLFRMQDALGERVESFDGCLDAEGNPGPCAPYDLDGEGGTINVADLARFVELFGTQPLPCPSCTTLCSGPACTDFFFDPGAMTWDPVGGPVWNTLEAIQSLPRLFVARDGVLGVRGLYAAHLEGERRFVFFPYAALNDSAFGLAFDPYPKNGGETTRKTLWGVGGGVLFNGDGVLSYWPVAIEGLDFQVTERVLTLPIGQLVDLANRKPIVKLAVPVDANPIVTDDPETCAPVDVTLNFGGCDLDDPNQVTEAAFWFGDRCRAFSFCSASPELCPPEDPNADCVEGFPDLDACYNAQRSCSDYCSPFRLGGPDECEPESELSGFAWDGEACVPFQGCCADVDCGVLFEDPNGCEAAFLEPRDTETNAFPAPPCPNFYHRPSCDPDAQQGTCGEGDPHFGDGFFWTGARCEDVKEFCCEGEDCSDAFAQYIPIPTLFAEDDSLTEEEKLQFAKTNARLECFRRHLRCEGMCEVLSEVREGLLRHQCATGEVFVNGYLWQFVPFPFNIAGAHRDCRLLQGCCRGPDCDEAVSPDPDQPGPVNTKAECLSSFPEECQGLPDASIPLSLFFENAGAVGGRLVASDGEGNLICLNPGFDPENLSVAPVSATRVIIPEKHLGGVTMVANFDVNADGEVNAADVCEVETLVAIGADPCKPVGTGDAVAGPCLPYPEGECSATADVNRDAFVDERDIELMERRVGLHCDGSPVSP